MAKQEFKATAKLFVDTKDAKSDAQQFFADIKKHMDDLEKDANKLKVFQSFSEYIATVDRNLSTLKAHNPNFNQMFGGLDDALRKNMEEALSYAKGVINEVEVLNDELAQVKSLRSELETAQRDAIKYKTDGVFGDVAKTKEEAEQLLAIYQKLHLEINDKKADKASLEYQKKRVEYLKVATKLAATGNIESHDRGYSISPGKLVSFKHAVVSANAYVSSITKSFGNSVNTALDKIVGRVETSIANIKLDPSMLRAPNTDSAEKIFYSYSKLKAKLEEYKRLANETLNPDLGSSEIDELYAKMEKVTEELYEIRELSSKESQGLSGIFDALQDGEIEVEEAINNISNLIGIDFSKGIDGVFDQVGKHAVDTAEYIQGITAQLRSMFDVLSQPLDVEYKVLINGQDINIKKGIDSQVPVQTIAETYLSNLDRDAIVSAHSHMGSAPGLNGQDLENIMKDFYFGTAKIGATIGGDSINTWNLAGVAMEDVAKAIKEIEKYGTDLNVDQINAIFKAINPAYTDVARKWKPTDFEGLAKYIYDIGQQSATALTPVERFQNVLKYFAKGIDLSKYQNLLADFKEENAGSLFNQIMKAEGKDLQVSDVSKGSLGDVIKDVQRQKDEMFKLRREAQLTYEEIEKISKEYYSSQGKSNVDFFKKYFHASELPSINEMFMDISFGQRDLTGVTKTLASYFNIDTDDMPIDEFEQTGDAAKEAKNKVKELYDYIDRNNNAGRKISDITYGQTDALLLFGDDAITDIKEKQKALKKYIDELIRLQQIEEKDGILGDYEKYHRRELIRKIQDLQLNVRYKDGSYYSTDDFGVYNKDLKEQIKYLNEVISLRKKIDFGFYGTGDYATINDTSTGDKMRLLLNEGMRSFDYDPDAFNASIIGQLIREYQHLHEAMLKCMLVGDEVPDSIIERLKWFESLDSTKLEETIPKLEILQSQIKEMSADDHLTSYKMGEDELYYDNKIQKLQQLIDTQKEYEALGGVKDSSGYSVTYLASQVEYFNKLKVGAKNVKTLKQELTRLFGEDFDKNSDYNKIFNELQSGWYDYDFALKEAKRMAQKLQTPESIYNSSSESTRKLIDQWYATSREKQLVLNKSYGIKLDNFNGLEPSDFHKNFIFEAYNEYKRVAQEIADMQIVETDDDKKRLQELQEEALHLQATLSQVRIGTSDSVFSDIVKGFGIPADEINNFHEVVGGIDNISKLIKQSRDQINSEPSRIWKEIPESIANDILTNGDKWQQFMDNMLPKNQSSRDFKQELYERLTAAANEAVRKQQEEALKINKRIALKNDFKKPFEKMGKGVIFDDATYDAYDEVIKGINDGTLTTLDQCISKFEELSSTSIKDLSALNEKLIIVRKIADAYDDLADAMSDGEDGDKEREKVEAFEGQYYGLIATMKDGSKVNITLDDDFSETTSNILRDAEKIQNIELIPRSSEDAMKAYERLDLIIANLNKRWKDPNTLDRAVGSFDEKHVEQLRTNLRSYIDSIKSGDADFKFGSPEKLQQAIKYLEKLDLLADRIDLTNVFNVATSDANSVEWTDTVENAFLQVLKGIREGTYTTIEQCIAKFKELSVVADSCISDDMNSTSTGSRTDGQVGPEILQLETLQQKLIEVRNAVDAKTRAFEEEYVTVDAAVDAEISALNQLLYALEQVARQVSIITGGLSDINNHKIRNMVDTPPDAALEGLRKKATQYTDAKSFAKDHVADLKNAGVTNGKLARAFWKDANYDRDDFKPVAMAMERVADIIRTEVPDNILEGWFREADSTYKTKLENIALTDNGIRNAALNAMWENYRQYSGKDIGYDEFLHSNIPVYRGKNSEKYVDGDELLSFTFDKSVAEGFGKHILEAVIRPIETIGSYQITKEAEVLIRRNKLEAMPGFNKWLDNMSSGLTTSFVQANPEAVSNKPSIDIDNVTNKEYALDGTLAVTNGILGDILAAINSNESINTMVGALNAAIQSLQDVASGIVQYQKAQHTNKDAAIARIADPTQNKAVSDSAINEISKRGLGTDVEIKKLQALANGLVKVEGAFRNVNGEWEGFTVNLSEANAATDLAIDKQSAFAKSLNKLDELQRKAADNVDTSSKQPIDSFNSKQFRELMGDANSTIRGLGFKLSDEDLTSQQKEIVDAYHKVVDAIDEQKRNVKDGGEVELAIINESISALKEKAELYRQQNNISNVNPKNFGATVARREDTRYDRLNKLATDTESGYSSSSKFMESFKQYKAAYNQLISKQKEFASLDSLTNAQVAEFDRLKDSCFKAGNELEKIVRASEKLANGQDVTKIDPLGEDFVNNATNRKNALIDFVKQHHDLSEAVIQFDKNYTKCIYTVENGDGTFTKTTAQLDAFKHQIVETVGATETSMTSFGRFFDEIKNKVRTISAYLISITGIEEIFQQIRQGIGYIKEIDTALTELKKVTNATDAEYDAFLQSMSRTASVVGSTVAELTTMSSEWARLGYTMQESAKLAESTAILLNVSEFENATDASQALISTMQAFSYTADESQHVVDILNEVKITCLLIQ